MNEQLEIVHVVAHVHRRASGPSRSVPGLCRALAERGARVRLHALEPSFPPPGVPYTFRQHPIWPVLRRLGISPALRRQLHAEARNAHILHNHGFWMAPNVYPHHACRNTPCLLVHSPRGMLAPVALSISRIKKRLFWWLFQGPAVRAAACLHATGEQEYRDLRRSGLHAPVAVIPNGVELPLERPAGDPDAPRRLLYLGRLHPIKGIDVLLRAWRRVQLELAGWELEIAGPDVAGYERRLRQLGGELGVERAFFTGPAYGDDKTAAFWRADLYVLPSRSENFGLTVGEALAHGLPVITTRGTPWSDLEKEDCGWWIENDEHALAACLRQAAKLSRSELRIRGTRGRCWIARDFSWSRVGTAMYETYLWLLTGGRPPGWVRTD